MEHDNLDINYSTFERGISKNLINLLNENAIWNEIIRKKYLKPFIRKDEIHVYYKGCKVFGLRQLNNKIIFETHQKYLDNFKDTVLRSNPYIIYDENLIDKNKKSITSASNFYDFLNTILENTKSYTSREKADIHEIMMNNPNILDVEVAFGGIKGKNKNNEDSNLHKRIDFAIVNEIPNSNEILLKFYESKQYSYTSSLRTSGENPAPIVDQLKLYDLLIKKHEDKLIKSYKNIIRQFSELKIENWNKYVDKEIIIDNKTKLIVTDIPVLKKRSKEAWEGHLGKIYIACGEQNVKLLNSGEFIIA